MHLSPTFGEEASEEEGGITAHSVAAWRATARAAEAVGIDAAELRGLTELLAGVLHLGDVRFQIGKAADTETAASVTAASRPSLAAAAELWQVSEDELRRAVCSRIFTAQGVDLECGRSPAAARASADALAKRVYAAVFSWLIGRLNTVIAAAPGGGGGGVAAGIVLLDIFGFECFEHNGFEQLLINYANEAIQLQFSSDVFRATEAECAAEGVAFDAADFEDNAACVALLDARGPPPGLLRLLAEEAALGNGSDDNFALKLSTMHRHHPAFRPWAGHSTPKAKRNPGVKSPPGSATPVSALLSPSGGRRAPQAADGTRRPAAALQFVLRHFAGDVVYCAEGWRERNDDACEPLHTRMLKGSTHRLIGELPPPAAASAGAAPPASPHLAALAREREEAAASSSSTLRSPSKEKAARPGLPESRSAVAWARTAAKAGGTNRAAAAAMALGPGRRAADTISGQFVSQLTRLRAQLSAAECHYVRCVKPNDRASPDEWQPSYVARQLAQSGVLEAARAARRGYPDRSEHAPFYTHFCLLSAAHRAAPVPSDAAALREKVESLCAELVQWSPPQAVAAATEAPGRLGGYQVGVTKVFLREGVLGSLEARRTACRAAAALPIQAVARGVAARSLLADARRAAITIQAAARGMRRGGSREPTTNARQG